MSFSAPSYRDNRHSLAALDAQIGTNTWIYFSSALVCLAPVSLFLFGDRCCPFYLPSRFETPCSDLSHLSWFARPCKLFTFQVLAFYARRPVYAPSSDQLPGHSNLNDVSSVPPTSPRSLDLPLCSNLSSNSAHNPFLYPSQQPHFPAFVVFKQSIRFAFLFFQRRVYLLVPTLLSLTFRGRVSFSYQICAQEVFLSFDSVSASHCHCLYCLVNLPRRH